MVERSIEDIASILRTQCNCTGGFQESEENQVMVSSDFPCDTLEDFI